ncbi:uncharacterized protein TRAVEDRAFT_130935, partial [Trametes versicolor FP-101664 SS1]|uniref:uncharacterized protein n=1 Tax=Trametes versicolor (strain FP-101664) TaxID=717944 RepID=UPI00046241F5
PSSRQSAFRDKYGKEAQEAMYARGAPPLNLLTCPTCNIMLQALPDSHRTLYRCDDCIGGGLRCRECLLTSHAERPLDRITAWDKTARLWVPETFANLGFELRLGHAGTQCPNSRSSRLTTIVHDRGIVALPIRYCRCSGVSKEPLQLIASGFWPATWKTPRTAMTLGVMDTYHMIARQAQVSVDDYVRHLARLTDNVLPTDIANRYREFNNASRQYDHLRRCAEYDVWVGDQLENGQLCQVCPACPQPDVNMREGWQERLPEYRYLDALQYSIDGNFHLSMKDRDTDPLDVALSDGAGYFVPSKTSKQFFKKTKPPKIEASTCNQFGAMGQGKYKGKVSGVVGISCRHMFMLANSIIDLIRAEQYQFVDLALLCTLQKYLILRVLFGTYDINCQYMINLRKRLADYGVVLAEIDGLESTVLPQIIAGVGKYHLSMHTKECRHKYSMHFLPGACMFDGEPMERIWAILNALALRTKEMSGGHRHDVLNEHFEDMNIRRLQILVKELLRKYEEGVKRAGELAMYLRRIETSIGPSHIVAWRVEEAAYLEAVVDITQHKNLKNIYEPPAEASLTQKDIVDQLAAEQAAVPNGEGMGLVGAIEDTLVLRQTRYALLVATFDGADAERVSLKAKVDAWHAHATRVSAACASALGAVVDDAIASVPDKARPEGFPFRTSGDDKKCRIPPPPPVPKCDGPQGKRKRTRETSELTAMTEELDEVSLLLPSDYHSAVRQHPAMAEAVKMERRLRGGEANEALEDLRLHLTTQMSLAERKTQGSGTIHNAAMDRRIHGKRDAIERAKFAYRRARVAMIVLGMPKNDPKYAVLHDADCKAFVIVDEEVRRGDSKLDPTWIWGDFTYMGKLDEGKIKIFVTNSVKVHWLRQSALLARWREEVNMLREEMYRTVQFFEYTINTWTRRAEKHDFAGRQGAAAYARRSVVSAVQ